LGPRRVSGVLGPPKGQKGRLQSFYFLLKA